MSFKISKWRCLFFLFKYTLDSYNPSHTVLYPHVVRALAKKLSHNELGYNEQSILRSLRVRYNEVLLYRHGAVGKASATERMTDTTEGGITPCNTRTRPL